MLRSTSRYRTGRDSTQPLLDHISQQCLAGNKWRSEGLQAGQRENLVEIITHPLWDCDPNHFWPQLAAAYKQAVTAGCQVQFKSIFEVLRRPF